jgi:hypothetical protein
VTDVFQVADSRPINTENRTTQLTEPTANALKGNRVMEAIGCISHAARGRQKTPAIQPPNGAADVFPAPHGRARVPAFHHAMTPVPRIDAWWARPGGRQGGLFRVWFGHPV